MPTHHELPASAKPMTRPGRRRVQGAAVALTVLAASAFLAWWFFFPIPAGPPEMEGRAWVAKFADLLTSPRALGARGPGALQVFPAFGAWPQGKCVTEWSRNDRSAPIVTYQRLELGLWQGEPCDQAQFGMLSTTLRQSEWVTPGAFVQRFTEQFGPPEFHRDRGLRGSISYDWQVLDGISINLKEPVGPGGGADFSLLFVRSYGAPTAIPTAAEARQWMDRTVALVSGPDLPAAHGPTAIGMAGAKMVGNLPDDSGCPTEYTADLFTPGAIASHQDLAMKRPDGQPCENATFVDLSMQIWRRDPVTPQALVERIEAKLGAPVISRDFKLDSVSYRWTTTHGTAVDLLEGLSGQLLHWLRLRVERS